MAVAVNREAYFRDGYIVLRGLFSRDEMAVVAAETEKLLVERKDLMETQNLRVRWHYHYDTGAPVFELFDPVVDIAPKCNSIAADERVREVLEVLFRDEPALIKDKLIYKQPGSGGYPLHQDYIAWPEFPESFTTVVVAIDQADTETGAIQLWKRAHLRGCLSARDGNFHVLPDKIVDGFEPVLLDLAPGDVAIFGCFMPHRSSQNRSDRWRRHLLFSYNAENDGGSQRTEHYESFHHYLRGIYGTMGLADLYFK